MLHRNGTPPASETTRSRAPAQAARTEFLPDRPADTARAWAYHLDRQQLGGVPLNRWLYGLLVAAALLLLLVLPSYGWWSALALLLSAAALWLWLRVERSRGYVRFFPSPLPAAEGVASTWPLAPSAKLPVYVSGLLSVDVKVRRFAALPGFYRTFATREHALLCQVRPRRLLGLATWPQEEEGLWYAFFYAHQVRRLQTGQIAFDGAQFPGFLIEYQPDKPLDGKARRRGPQRITLYVAFPQAADYQAALADLMVEPIGAAQLQSSER